MSVLTPKEDEEAEEDMNVPGPKISSLTMVISGVTSVKIVGWMKKPSVPWRSPPWWSVAPSFLPISMCFMMR